MIKRTLIFMTICLFSVSIFSAIEHNWDDLDSAELLGPSQDNEFKSPEMLGPSQDLEDTPLFQAVLNQDTPTFKEELEKLDFNELLSTIQAQTASGHTLMDTMAKISDDNLLTIQAQIASGSTLMDTIRENQELNPNQLTLQMQLLVKRLLELGLEKNLSIRSLYNYIAAPNNHTLWSIITRENPLTSLFHGPTKKLLSRFEKWGRIQDRLQNGLSMASGATAALTSFSIILSIINGSSEAINNLSEGDRLLMLLYVVPLTGGIIGSTIIGNFTGKELGAKLCKNMFLKKL